MTSSTLLGRGALAAILAAGCLFAPTARAQSAHHGPSVKDWGRANVYVPPVPNAGKTANVYVPPVPNAGKTANVYVPPVPNVAQRPARPTTLTRAAPAPADDGGAGPWAVIGLAFGGAALLGGVGLALAHRARRARRAVA